MGIGIQEMNEACEQARKNTPWWKWWQPALTLHAPQVLDVIGKYIPAEASNDPGAMATIVQPRPTYGYSRKQCAEIQDAIYMAALADLEPPE